MSTPSKPHNEFEAIALEALQNVAGGAARSSKGGDSELTAMLTSITSSIKDLASSKNQGQDPMQMIMIMMMMGGMGGGGGGGVIGAPVAAAPPVINVDTGISGGGGGGGGGCRRGGKKGW
ncbi:MAG: hypothetical protein H0V17_23290 [Deltaproteobacteria bacterium]|nr:hypothetical protein [Deltaproteobacteria bacterium]